MNPENTESCEMIAFTNEPEGVSSSLASVSTNTEAVSEPSTSQDEDLVRCKMHPHMQRHVATQVSWPTAVRKSQNAFSGPPQGIRKPFGKDPMRVNCPYCNETVTSVIHKRPNPFWLYIFGICALMFDGCKDVDHQCPKCYAILGIYRPSMQ